MLCRLVRGSWQWHLRLEDQGRPKARELDTRSSKYYRAPLQSIKINDSILRQSTTFETFLT